MFLIGIAGGSGSGKTTFAKRVLENVWEQLGDHPASVEKSVVLLHQDSYYLKEPANHLKIHGEPNFDHPDAFDWDLLKKHLWQLKRGAAIQAPIYDFNTSRRKTETERVGPCKVIVMEGIYTLWDAEIRALFDLKIYVDVDADIRFIRRLHRDVRERGRTLDQIIRQYYDTVRPMHREYLEPTRQYADIVVGEESALASEIIAARVREFVRR